MQLRSSGLGSLALVAIALAGPAQRSPDPISGAWNVTFFVEGYPPTPATFELAVEGDKVTGTVLSDHTGPGKVTQGTWVNGKLSFVAVFEKHESIAITGAIDNGKLAGEFRTEGFVAKWEGARGPSKKPW